MNDKVCKYFSCLILFHIIIDFFTPNIILSTNSCCSVFSNKGHSSFITHIDWSKDSEYLRSNSGDYELLYCKYHCLSNQIRYSLQKYFTVIIVVQGKWNFVVKSPKVVNLKTPPGRPTLVSCRSPPLEYGPKVLMAPTSIHVNGLMDPRSWPQEMILAKWNFIHTRSNNQRYWCIYICYISNFINLYSVQFVYLYFVIAKCLIQNWRNINWVLKMILWGRLCLLFKILLLFLNTKYI